MLNGAQGPRTAGGKAIVSANALKHGLTGRDIVLPNENPDDFEAFRTGLLTSLDPQGDLEEALAEKYIADAWRLRRVPMLEATFYRRGYRELLVRQAEKTVNQYENVLKNTFARLQKDVDPRFREAHGDAEQRLTSAQAELDDPSFHVTHVLKEFSQPLSNLWRHEVALERSMLRTLHELQRLQAKSAGEYVPTPEVMDVDLSLPEPRRTDNGSSSPSGERDGNQQ